MLISWAQKPVHSVAQPVPDAFVCAVLREGQSPDTRSRLVYDSALCRYAAEVHLAVDSRQAASPWPMLFVVREDRRLHSGELHPFLDHRLQRIFVQTEIGPLLLQASVLVLT